MDLVGLTRLGEANDPDATWVVPPSLTSKELQDSIDLIQKFEFDPPVYEDGKTAEDFLRSKAAAARRSARRADYDDDSEGEDTGSEADRGEYVPDGPTSRKSTAKKILKRRRRERTPVELDDEEREARADARRQKELEKMAKIKSTLFVHDSDDESDEERDREFFAREAALREGTTAKHDEALTSGLPVLETSKKRKNDEHSKKSSKRRKSPPKKRGPFDDSSDDEDDLNLNTSSRESSEEAADTDLDENTDTPLSSQHAAGAAVRDNDREDDNDDDDEDGLVKSSNSLTTQGKDVVMDEDGDEEDDDVPVARRPTARKMRGGFVIDSDSE